MRRRSTFVTAPGIDYDPSKLNINGRHLSFAGLKAAREERLTFGFDELPTEVIEVLRKSHELHVRWVSDTIHEKSGPYLSALTPGVHVHYTPDGKEGNEQLCPLLRTLLSSSLKCNTTGVSFSRPDILSDRFSSAASLQFYSVLPTLQQLVAWIQRASCDPSDIVCTHTVALLNIASYLDFDYDSISHALTVTAYWSKPPAVLVDPVGEWTTYDHWNMALDASPNEKTEVGLLRASPAAEPSDINMEGFLTVVGEDTEPKPTMFFFPSRHHILASEQRTGQKYTVSFDQPTGLHPSMRITFPLRSALQEPANKPEGSTCALHTYLTLPSVIFADQYAFPTSDQDLLFTEAHNIVLLRSLSGERDLEAPEYKVQRWGSAILLELAIPASISSQPTPGLKPTWDITIPLHLRYLEPVAGGQKSVQVPWPIVFWACTAEEGTKFTVNPFDRVNLGYDGLFGPRTMFYHLSPQPMNGTSLIEHIQVPVLNTDVMSYGLAEVLTTIFVLSGSLWVAWKVLRDVLWEVDWWSKSKSKSSDRKKTQ